jgi:arylsulfatase A
MHDYYNWRLEFGEDTVRRGDGRYLTDVWTEEAAAFIERHRTDQPFFLHVTYNAPHTPLQAPDDEVKLFLETGEFNKAVSTVYAMIHRMDTGLARILETVEKHGLTENTIVIFTSDNGPAFHGQGEFCQKRFNCGFHGAKALVYEGGIRVPLILRWPAGIEGGRQEDRMFHFCDWFPTLLAAAGVAVPPELRLDGINTLPILQGEAGKAGTKRFWQWNRYTPVKTCNAAIRDGDWKLVRPRIEEVCRDLDGKWLAVSMYTPEHFIERGLLPGLPGREPPPAAPPAELYHIGRDPLEQTNLAGQEPDRVRRMLRELETWFEEVEAERATIDDEWFSTPEAALYPGPPARAAV